MPGDMVVFISPHPLGMTLRPKFSFVVSIVEKETQLDVLFLHEPPFGMELLSYGRHDKEGATFDEISSLWEVWRNGEVVRR